MTPALIVSPEHHAAYDATHYVVGDVTLRIGASVARLDGVFGTAWRRVAVISAANPFSELLADDENAARHEALLRDVARAGRFSRAALGRDPAGVWPPEVSLAVVDASDDELDDWLFLHCQNAIVVAPRGGVATLRFHPHERGRVADDPGAAGRAAARVIAAARAAGEVQRLAPTLREDVVVVSSTGARRAVGRAGALALLRVASAPGEAIGAIGPIELHAGRIARLTSRG